MRAALAVFSSGNAPCTPLGTSGFPIVASLRRAFASVNTRAHGLNRTAGQHGGGSGVRPRPCQPLLAAAVPFSAGATAAKPLQPPRICILGGGFGGLNTAVKLDGLVWPEGTKPQITLVDANERFVFKPLLYELLSGAAGEEEVAPTFEKILRPTSVSFVRGQVESVNDGPATGPEASSGGSVTLKGGALLSYDWLVLALGSEPRDAGVPGVKELTHGFTSYEDVLALRGALAALAGNPAPRAVVVGGGYAGVELAAVLADVLPPGAAVSLLASGSDILPAAPAGQRQIAREALAGKGVRVVTGARVAAVESAAGWAGGAGAAGMTGTTGVAGVAGVSGTATSPLTAAPVSWTTPPRRVLLEGAAAAASAPDPSLEAEVVVWAAGSGPTHAPGAGPPGSAPFPTDAGGATQTDATLRVLGHPHVFALGDVAVCAEGAGSPGSGVSAPPRLPATAQVALQQADYVAWNLWAAATGRPLLPFAYQHLGEMMSLGSRAGAVTLPLPIPPALADAARGAALGPLLRAAGLSVHGDGSGAPDRLSLEGPLAAAVRRAAYAYRQPTPEQQARAAADLAKRALGDAAGLARSFLDQAAKGLKSGAR
uniref:FAD/NAD(P)-binding domain-containing protein n=1 Tax=Auxenochlorella protothecoides TaxID=3075 RepID=A0A1D2AGM5_AUXPR